MCCGLSRRGAAPDELLCGRGRREERQCAPAMIAQRNDELAPRRDRRSPPPPGAPMLDIAMLPKLTPHEPAATDKVAQNTRSTQHAVLRCSARLIIMVGNMD